MHVPKDKPLAAWIKELIDENKLYKFYKSPEWLELRQAIIDDNHNECAWCKAKGKVSAVETVHHIKEVKKFPELALSRTYTDGKGVHKNLVPLCHDCHDVAHGRFKGAKPKGRRILNKERW